MAAGVGDAVLNWLRAHPHPGEIPAEGGIISFRRESDGTIGVLGEVPDTIGATIAFLDGALDEYVTFDDGVITLHVAPEPLRYRPLHADNGVVMCARERYSTGGWIPGPTRDVVVRAGEQVLSSDMLEA
jgi:hypothetical protein